MSKIIAIWLGYGTAQFCSLSSIDFWQTEGKERTDGERKKLSCWWWNTLSHWIIKMVLPSPEQLFRLEYKINTYCLFRKPRNTVNKNEHRVQFQVVSSSMNMRHCAKSRGCFLRWIQWDSYIAFLSLDWRTVWDLFSLTGNFSVQIWGIYNI